MTTPAGARPGRTLIASILFVDIVGFSLTTVSEQISLKQALSAMLRNTLTALPPDEYRMMDTGDGAAIGFLSDPEHALYFALAIDSKCRQPDAPSELHHGSLRMGINFGPVKEVVDVNDRPSLIGDGINSAQRVMTFAEPGQITVAYAFFDLVSRLAPEYTGLFAHVGAHDDKHGRGHDIYVLKPSRSVLEKVRARLELAVAETTGIHLVLPPAEPTRPPMHVTTPPSETSGSGGKRVKRETPPVAPAKKERDFEWPIALLAGAGVLLLIGALVAFLPGLLGPELTRSAPAPAAPAASPAAPAPPVDSARAPTSAPAASPGTPAHDAPPQQRPAARTPAEPSTRAGKSPAAAARPGAPVTPEAVCSSILHKASLGEALTSEERKIIVGCK